MELQSFLYERKEEGIVIWRCFQKDGQVVIPAYIEGVPVVGLAPYVFSAHADETLLKKKVEAGELSRSRDSLFACQTYDETAQKTAFRERTEQIEQALCGEALTHLTLPDSVREVGRYAFYNCRNLQELRFSGNLKNLGAGAFTGCHHLKHLYVKLFADKSSCLKEILTEVHEALLVNFEGQEEAKVLFPAFFEEGVENTPARILMTEVHGSGLHFRNCFQQRVFDQQEYDRLFPLAEGQEMRETAMDMALLRLRWPIGLLKKAEERYLNYLSMDVHALARHLMKKQDGSWIRFILQLEFLPEKKQELVTSMLTLASEMEFPEAVSLLMDHRRGAVVKKRRSFDL